MKLKTRIYLVLTVIYLLVATAIGEAENYFDVPPDDMEDVIWLVLFGLPGYGPWVYAWIMRGKNSATK